VDHSLRPNGDRHPVVGSAKDPTILTRGSSCGDSVDVGLTDRECLTGPSAYGTSPSDPNHAITVDMRGCQERLSFDIARADGSLWRACQSSHSGSSAVNNGSPSRHEECESAFPRTGCNCQTGTRSFPRYGPNDHSVRTSSGRVIRSRRGRVDDMTPRESKRPPTTIRK
jgi:hypothetical protein